MKISTFLCYTLYLSPTVSAFVSPKTPISVAQQIQNMNSFNVRRQSTVAMDCPPTLVRQRKSMANVQTMGFFGLGAPEIIIILIAAAFLAGPQKLAELGKEAGKMSSDFKDVPAEFQKGFEEGEIEARSRVAKQMDDPAE